ncbi:MAG TPA: molybdopterin cofactor-binding domain-containing protein [Actinomycetes bacterium]
MSRHQVTLTVNGEQRQAEVEARRRLVHLLREDLGVTGVHVGCDTTQCGACTVHLDGRAVKSCAVLAVQADGATVDTLESLSKTGDVAHPLLAGFRKHHALQCGFCTPGMIMSSLELLRHEPQPSEERIRAWLKGNFCRCTGYQHIVDAIRAAGGTSVTGDQDQVVTSPPSSRGTATEESAAANPAVAEAPPSSATQDSRCFGRPLQRREDDHHLRGRGQFTDDVRPTHAVGVLHAALLRSPYAHARIRSVSVDRARRMPGVVAVITGADLLDSVSPLPTNWVLPGMPVPVHRVLADQVVRFHGEAVAVVVAADAAAAADAAQTIDVGYEPLPAVTDLWRAAQPDAPAVHPELDGASEHGNILFRFPTRAGDYAAARQAADVVVGQRLRNQNMIPGALEPRSVLADYDDRTGTVTVHSSTQSPHTIKRMLAEVLSFPEHRLGVVAPDVGGGFGSKLHLYPEEALVTALAIRLRRAVKWTATRSEDFQATNHGRDHVQDVELCATADGVITGIKATLFANLGAYVSGMAAGIPTANCAFMVTGVYQIPNVQVDTLGVLTNTSRVDTYRGAGRPEATYLIERMVDQLARELRIDPAEIRRRNFIPPDAFPYPLPTGGFVFDSGNYQHNLDTALDRIGYDKLRREQAELRSRGRCRGIGLATYTEFTGLGPGWANAQVGFSFGGWEYARVLVHPAGNVSVHVGSADHGQGHQTSYTQIAADALGLRPDDIEVAEGDTARVEFGCGTFNSRSMPVGGSAVHECSQRVLAKARQIAAHALGAAAEDVRSEAGVFTASKPTGGGARAGVTWKEAARLAYFAPDLPPGMEPGLDERVFYDPKGLAFPFGTYIAVVDVDPATGDITIDRFLAVDDCGPLINPMLARGQVHGGIAQGLGQALLEGARYDDAGCLVSRDWTTYAFPRAQHIPHLETAHTVTPSPLTPLGIKGIGEAGAIATPPAIVNAVLDALAPLGVTHLDMPLHPERVLAAIRQATADPRPLGGAP